MDASCSGLNAASLPAQEAAVAGGLAGVLGYDSSVPGALRKRNAICLDNDLGRTLRSRLHPWG